MNAPARLPAAPVAPGGENAGAAGGHTADPGDQDESDVVLLHALTHGQPSRWTLTLVGELNNGVIMTARGAVRVSDSTTLRRYLALYRYCERGLL